MTETPDPSAQQPLRTGPLPYLRLAITGVFMGLANLVPGVSGGTMVLVLGLYDEFIGAFSDLTRLKITRRSIIVVTMLFAISGVTIFTLAEGIQFMMETFLPGMLALFIGMTLGGVPHLYKEMRPLKKRHIIWGIGGLVIMALIAFVFKPDQAAGSWFMFLIGGFIGSSAMILPGISGSYMLLILGLYLPIIRGITLFKDALKARDIDALFQVGTDVILPVGLGLVIGLVLLSNLLRYFLKHHHASSLGFLTGLLLGSVLGLYPFAQPTFHKLPRYAIQTETPQPELRVIGRGWHPEPGNPIFEALSELEADGQLKLNIIDATDTEPISTAHIETARKLQSVVIAYDIPVTKQIRRNAAGSDKAKEVELLIIPNTEFTTPKLLLACLLALAGFGLTMGLGKIDGSNRHE